MGYEYITQPQIFLAPISALNGIQGVNEAYPLLTTFESWTSTAAVDASAFPIPGYWTMLDEPESFIVSIGGVIQPPSEYTIDRNLRYLTFNTIVSAGLEVAATQIATHAPSSQSFDYVTSVSADFDQADIGTLSAVDGIFNTVQTASLTATSANIQNAVVTTLTAGQLVAFYTVLETAGDFTLSDSNSNNVIHFDTTSVELTAIFPDSLSDGFNANLFNVGTGTIAVSSTQLNNVKAAGSKNSTQYTGITIYKHNGELYGMGVFNA